MTTHIVTKLEQLIAILMTDDRCTAENEGGRCVKKAGHSGRHLGQELETFAELFGRLGGLATAAKLTPAERSAKARKAAAARWNRRDGQ